MIVFQDVDVSKDQSDIPRANALAKSFLRQKLADGVSNKNKKEKFRNSYRLFTGKKIRHFTT
jgi:hypothetical protein